jgi:hypothetical protein
LVKSTQICFETKNTASQETTTSAAAVTTTPVETTTPGAIVKQLYRHKKSSLL